MGRAPGGTTLRIGALVSEVATGSRVRGAEKIDSLTTGSAAEDRGARKVRTVAIPELLAPNRCGRHGTARGRIVPRGRSEEVSDGAVMASARLVVSPVVDSAAALAAIGPVAPTGPLDVTVNAVDIGLAAEDRTPVGNVARTATVPAAVTAGN